MAKQTLTIEDASELHTMLLSQSAAQAAEWCHTSRIAIRPYTDNRLERLQTILRKLAAQETCNPDGYAKNLGIIAQIANEATK